MVHLVGTGPGDPGLVTLRALECVRSADVLLYDRLIDDTLLAETSPDCELIDVGKSAGNHTRTQDETIALILEHAGRGKEVVRLKGGDPFLFGRGGEEAEALAAANIQFTVVPGVSALTAATAYAGIPVTHRGRASSVTAATGHGAAGRGDDPVDWRALGRGADTIVVFMGVGNLETVTSEIVAGGRSADTPAALIERGCSPRQRVVTGTLADIADVARNAGVSPPALFIAGDTVPLAETIGWYKPGPLGGLRVGVTRPLSQTRGFCKRLRDLGAMPVVMPVIESVDTIETESVARSVRDIEAFGLVVFSSVNGVDAFFRALSAAGKDARVLAGARLACIGPITAERLTAHGLRADIVAERYVAEGLRDIITEGTGLTGTRALVVRSEVGRTVLREGLEASGADVAEAICYTVRPVPLRPHIRDMISAGGLDVVTFTSSSTVTAFFDQVQVSELPAALNCASIGPQTSATLRDLGMEPMIESEVYTTDGLADALLNTFARADDY